MTKSQLEDFMWTSWRYCIGRRTAAAAMHTDNIAELIANNPNVFSQERLEFNAKDIRRQISQVCTYGDSIEVNTCRDMDDSLLCFTRVQRWITHTSGYTRLGTMA